jgi:hypothetical protein
MQSQMTGIGHPHVVAVIKNAKEQGNFATFQQFVESNVEVGTFRDGNQGDVQRYADIVTKYPIPAP